MHRYIILQQGGTPACCCNAPSHGIPRSLPALFTDFRVLPLISWNILRLGKNWILALRGRRRQRLLPLKTTQFPVFLSSPHGRALSLNTNISSICLLLQPFPILHHGWESPLGSGFGGANSLKLPQIPQLPRILGGGGRTPSNSLKSLNSLGFGGRGENSLKLPQIHQLPRKCFAFDQLEHSQRVKIEYLRLDEEDVKGCFLSKQPSFRFSFPLHTAEPLAWIRT